MFRLFSNRFVRPVIRTSAVASKLDVLEKTGMKVFVCSPTKVIYNDVATMVTATTSDGVIGLLANHVPLIAQLVPSIVDITGPAGIVKIVVAGGTLVMNRDSALHIMVSGAVFPTDIDTSKIPEEERRLKHILETTNDPNDKKAAEACLATINLFSTFAK